MIFRIFRKELLDTLRVLLAIYDANLNLTNYAEQIAAARAAIQKAEGK